MRAFRFRLEKVLEWYTRLYELEERRYQAAMGALADARLAIAKLESEQLGIEREVVSRYSIPARDFTALGLYRLGARKRKLVLDANRERCEAEVEAQRARLQQAQRRVRLIEKLRERRAAEYAYEEARELEELASDAFFAKWASNG